MISVQHKLAVSMAVSSIGPVRGATAVLVRAARLRLWLPGMMRNVDQLGVVSEDGGVFEWQIVVYAARRLSRK